MKKHLKVAAVLGAAVMLLSGFSGTASGGAAELTMSKTELELYVGETDSIAARGGSASWSSSDESVVKVDSEGNITGVAVGKATVTASRDGSTGVCTVYVVEKEYSFDDNIMISIFWPPTSNYVNDEQYKLLADANITWVMGSGDVGSDAETQKKMLALCYKYGMRMTLGASGFGGSLLSMNDSSIKSLVNTYRNIPGCNGYYMLDEPLNANIFLPAYVSLKSADPNSYMHLNFLPYGCYTSVKVYKKQMSDWLKLCEANGYVQDYLMYDLYPYGTTKNDMNREGFFTNLNAVREVGLENGVKTACYIQSVGITGAYRSPNEAETRYEINAALAYGIKQLSYFTWFTPVDRGAENFFDGIISPKGVPNEKYEWIKQINSEVLTIGKTLINCDALQVYTTGNKCGGLPKLKAGFFAQRSGTCDMLLSYLRDRNTGRNYLMVVNNSFTKEQSFSLQLDEKITSLSLVSRATGELEALSLADGNILSDTFAAGEGRLYALPEGVDYGTGDEEAQPAGTNLARTARITADSSLGSDNCYIDNLNDGVRFTSDSSNGWRSNNEDSVTVTVDLRSRKEFNRIDLYPVTATSVFGAEMPVDFTVEYSVDGESWKTIATAEGFSVMYNTAPSLKFDTVNARYIRIVMTKFNSTYAAMGEIEVYLDDGSVPAAEAYNADANRGKKEGTGYTVDENVARGKSVTVSSYPSSASYKEWGWWPDFLTDGTYNKGWTSNIGIHSSADSTEYAIIDLGQPYAIDKLRAAPMGCAPVDFNITVSTDGVTWTTIEEVTDAANKTYTFKLDTPVVCRYVKYTGTKLTGTGADGYMLQLAEIEVYGTPYVDKTELKSFIDAYASAGGDTSAQVYTDVTAIYDALPDSGITADMTQSQVDHAAYKMLSTVGLTLEPTDKPTADYKFTYAEIKNEEDTTDGVTTSEPTEDTGTPADTSAADTSGTSSSGKGNTAILIVGCVVIALLAAVLLFVVFRKKKA